MSKTCNACGGAVCEVCGGCIAHGECSCMEDQIQKHIDRAEVAEARLSLTEKNAAKILAKHDELRAKFLQFARLIVIAEMDGDPDFDTYGVCIEAGLEDEFLEGRSFKEIILERAKTAIAELVGAENAGQE